MVTTQAQITERFSDLPNFHSIGVELTVKGLPYSASIENYLGICWTLTDVSEEGQYLNPESQFACWQITEPQDYKNPNDFRYPNIVIMPSIFEGTTIYVSVKLTADEKWHKIGSCTIQE